MPDVKSVALRALLVLCVVSFPTSLHAREEPKRAAPEAGASVVFVCEHGNVKSLIAKEWFNRLASERGLKVRATSRGMSPEASVAPPIATRLREDGFDVEGFRPRPFEASDLADASRIVLIGVEPPAFTNGASVRIDRWEGVPPASVDYQASRDVLKARIAALLDELEGPARER